MDSLLEFENTGVLDHPATTARLAALLVEFKKSGLINVAIGNFIVHISCPTGF